MCKQLREVYRLNSGRQKLRSEGKERTDEKIIEGLLTGTGGRRERVKTVRIILNSLEGCLPNGADNSTLLLQRKISKLLTAPSSCCFLKNRLLQDIVICSEDVSHQESVQEPAQASPRFL